MAARLAWSDLLWSWSGLARGTGHQSNNGIVDSTELNQELEMLHLNIIFLFRYTKLRLREVHHILINLIKDYVRQYLFLQANLLCIVSLLKKKLKQTKDEEMTISYQEPSLFQPLHR